MVWTFHSAKIQIELPKTFLKEGSCEPHASENGIIEHIFKPNSFMIQNSTVFVLDLLLTAK